MKILIVSDSHGSKKELELLLSRHKDEIDAMIHCGDSELSFNDEVMESFIKVRGNCDMDPVYPDEETRDIGGNRFYTTHGHLYNVKMTLMNIMYRAKELNAKICCYGHSHIAHAEQENGVIFINPGSIHLPKLRKEKTYAICEIVDQKAEVCFYSENGTKIEELSKCFEIR